MKNPGASADSVRGKTANSGQPEDVTAAPNAQRGQRHPSTSIGIPELDRQGIQALLDEMKRQRSITYPEDGLDSAAGSSSTEQRQHPSKLRLGSVLNGTDSDSDGQSVPVARGNTTPNASSTSIRSQDTHYSDASDSVLACESPPSTHVGHSPAYQLLEDVATGQSGKRGRSAAQSYQSTASSYSRTSSTRSGHSRSIFDDDLPARRCCGEACSLICCARPTRTLSEFNRALLNSQKSKRDPAVDTRCFYVSLIFNVLLLVLATISSVLLVQFLTSQVPVVPIPNASQVRRSLNRISSSRNRHANALPLLRKILF